MGPDELNDFERRIIRVFTERGSPETNVTATAHDVTRISMASSALYKADHRNSVAGTVNPGECHA